MKRLHRGPVLGAMLAAALGGPVAWAGDAAKLVQALSGSIVEGQSLAGVRLGATEGELVALLGMPDRVDSFLPGAYSFAKVVHYITASPPVILRVVFREARVEAVLVIAVDLSLAAAITGTARGVGLGSTVRDVRVAYGRTAGRLWYPVAGIAFNPAEQDFSDQDPVYAILVTRPGLDDKLVAAYGRIHH